MHIKFATTVKEKRELDRLLWDVLWKPLQLPRNIRTSFKLNKPQIDLIAVDNEITAGALVANWLSENTIEIRHIAVRLDYQRNGVGRSLIDYLIHTVQERAPLQIQTYARNISTAFFSKLGFKPTGEVLEHEGFRRHGINFQKMFTELTTEQQA